MRVALIADVHANFPALQAILADASRKKVDEYWSLGDMVGYGPFPNEVIASLRQVCARHIAGNYDIKCTSQDHVERMKAAGKDKDKIFSFEWTLNTLSVENQVFIQQLPETDQVDIAGQSLMLVHGSSFAIDDILTPRSAAEKYRSLAADAVRRKAHTVVFGHTHEYVDRTVDGVRFINPGGAGRSFDGDPRTSYCIIEIKNGMITVERYRLEYSLDASVGIMRDKGFPERLISTLIEARSLEEIDGLKRESVEGLLAAAIELAKSLQSKMGHSVQVARLALQLFDDLAEFYGLGWRERALLGTAALLHDIGWIYGQEGHHKASRDLILKDSTLPLNLRERSMVALIARYHRKSLPEGSHKGYKDLTAYEKELVSLLAGLLRIADGLDCTHTARVAEVSAVISRVRMTLSVRPEPGVKGFVEIQTAQEKSDLLRFIYGPDILIKKKNL